MDSSSISTSEYFHFSLDKSPFDNDLNTTYNEDILDTEVVYIFTVNNKMTCIYIKKKKKCKILDGWK